MRGYATLRGYWPLLLLSAAAVGVPLAMLATVSITNYRDIEQTQFDAARHTAEALTEHALRTFRAQELMVDVAGQLVEGQPWPQLHKSAALSAKLARLVRAEPDIGSIVITSPDGRETISNNGSFRDLGVAQRDYFTTLRDSAEPRLIFGEPAIGAVSRERIFNLAKRRTDADGRFQGVVMVAVRTAYFESMYSELLRDPADSIGLVRSDGMLVARGPAYSKPMTLPPDSGLMKAIRDNPKQGQFESRAVLDNVLRIYAYQKIGDYPMYISVARAKHAVWAEWQTRMIPFVILCAASILLLLFAVFLASRHYRNELRAMRRLAEEASLRARVEADKVSLEEDSRSKDAFLAGLSHELRNPIGSIALAVETLDRSMRRDGGPAEQALRILGNQTRQLRRLLEDMLDLAGAIHGKISLKPVSIELHAFVSELLQTWKPEARPAVELSLSGEAVWVSADPSRLQQIFLNLLDNAVKYGGHRVRVKITRMPDPDGGPVWAEASVTDDGEGIASAVLPSLFEPFVRGPNASSRAGLGLGLALIRRLVQLHGGDLSGYSEGPGQGARFVVRLPAVAAAAQVTAPPVKGMHADAPMEVLVVDDQEDARVSLQLVLEMEGHHVRCAESAQAALALMQVKAPDIVFCDIGMPVMDGCQFAEKARLLDRGRAVVLVALSGYGTEADRDRTRRAGFDFHLIKPASMGDIQKVLQTVTSGGAAP